MKTLAFLTTLVALCTFPISAEELRAVDIRQVKVGGEIGRRIDATVSNNLLVIDLDKDFLAPFLERNRKDGYIGVGKTLDAFARFCAYTGNPELIARKKHIADTLIGSQEPDGYIGMFAPEARVTQLWDTHEMAYLVLGLTSDYQFCGEKASRDAACKLADYLIARLGADPAPAVGPEDLSRVMGTTGLDAAFLNLSDVTGDPRYRDFVVDNRKLSEWRMPLVLGRWGKVEGHAYAYLAECLAQARLYRHAPQPGLWEASRGVLDFLVLGDGLVITGTCGDHECWHNTQSGTTNLGETCTVAYMLRWYDGILRQTGDAAYGDLMERAIYNALFAAQSPDGRRIRYYSPFEAPRTYFEADTYCCPSNFRRIMAELPGMIAYRKGDGAYVNLYTPSTVSLELENGVKLTLRQETDYPNSGRITVHVETSAPAEFPLSFRLPKWCKRHTGGVRGAKAFNSSTGDGLLTFRSEWSTGDRVELDFPMEWRLVEGRRAQEGRAAVMRGPQVFSYNPKHNPDFKDLDPRLMTLAPASIEGPFPVEDVRPGAVACRVRLWEPGAWYPHAETRAAVLTDYPDPDATWTYFLVPDPADPSLQDDELVNHMPRTP